MSLKADNLNRGILAGIRAYEGLSMAGGGLAALAQGGVTRMAEGGNPYSYEYDPVLQRYVEKRTDSGPKSIADPDGLRALRKYTAEGSEANKASTNPAWDAMSNFDRAAYFSANPGMGSVHRGLLALAEPTLLGTVAKAYNPEAFSNERMMSYGISPDSVGRVVSALGEEVTGPGTIGSRDNRGSNEPSVQTPGLSPEQQSVAAAMSDYAESPSGPSNSDYGYGSEGAATGADMDAAYAYGGLAALAQGGVSHLGDYSDGGRLLRGPGDGVSDSIPATIGDKRPARLADGEFVVPARIVSELGNGSTEAGARKLYAMMDRIQQNRSKTVGKGRVAVNSRSDKALPA